jgi:hypothetical protein
LIRELSKEDQDLLRLGPQPYLPDQVIRYQQIVEMLKKDDKDKKKCLNRGT